MNSEKDPASKYFSSKVTDRDRALFEAGISIGTLVHQFTGIPVKNPEDIPVIEEAIKRSLLAQPYRVDALVKINIDLSSRDTPYNYTTLKARHINARITVEYGKYRVVAGLRYIPELDYNLGYIEDIEEK